MSGDPARRIPTVSSTVRPGVSHTSEVVTAVRRAYNMAGVGPKDIDVLEMDVVIIEACVACSRDGFGLADKSFYIPDLLGVYLVGLLGGHKAAHAFVDAFEL